MGATTLYNFKTKLLDFTPTLDTNAYAQHDILFDFTALTLGEGGSATRPIKGTINNFTLLDKDHWDSLVFKELFHLLQQNPCVQVYE